MERVKTTMVIEVEDVAWSNETSVSSKSPRRSVGSHFLRCPNNV